MNLLIYFIYLFIYSDSKHVDTAGPKLADPTVDSVTVADAGQLLEVAAEASNLPVVDVTEVEVQTCKFC